MSRSRAENTCNAILCEELRHLGLDAFFEEQFLTMFGTSKPDLHINRANNNYFIEAKQRPNKLVDAVSKAYTYQKKLKVMSPKAIFAILYSSDCLGQCEAAVLLNQPPFYLSHSTANLRGLAEWIEAIITEPPSAVELNVTDAIGLLRDAVSKIKESLSEIGTKDVEDIFGGTVFFETILGVKEEKEIPIDHLREATSYLIVNQIIFYQILAKEKTGLIRYSEIDSEKLSTPSELHSKYFAKVLLEDYKPIFGFDVATRIKGSAALEAIKVTVDAVNALLSGSLEHDILGKIFHNLIPLDLRKVIAAFYTNIQAGEILATLAIDDPDASVFDPACGSGTLLVSSYQRKRFLFQETGKNFTFSVHKRFLEKDITGVDIMPFAAHLAAVNLSLQAPLFTTDFVRVAIQDSTTLKPNMEIAPAQEVLKETFEQRKLTENFLEKAPRRKKRLSTGVVELSDQTVSKPIRLERVKLVIMNPPFTRFQRIPPTYKTKLANRFTEKKYKECIHGQLGLHGYFLLLADRFLEDDGRLAAVLPVTTLSAKGLYPIQEMLLKNYSIEHIVVCEGRSAFSENTLAREILLVARKRRSGNNNTAISILKFSPDTLSVSKARSLGEDIKELREKGVVGVTDTSSYLFRLIPQKQLAKSRRSLFRAISTYHRDMIEVVETIQNLLEQSENATTFGEYLKSVRGEIHESPRGIERLGYYGLAMVSNENRALKKHDFWYVKDRTKQELIIENRFSHLVFDLPLRCIYPNIRRQSGLSKFDISGETDYVLVSAFDKLSEFVDASQIDTSERNEALKRVRSGLWEDFVRKHSSKLALFYRIDITAIGTHNLAFYSNEKMFFGGSLWEADIEDDAQNRLLCLWFNSTLNLLQVLTERKETRGGWMWLDDYILRDFVMPDLANLTQKEISTLLEAFSRCGKKSLPSILEQLNTKNAARRDIDRCFLLMLGMPEEEMDTFLDRLYSVLAREISKLRDMMFEGREPEEV